MSDFIRHLKACARLVKGWPKWKRESILPGDPKPIPTRYITKEERDRRKKAILEYDFEA